MGAGAGPSLGDDRPARPLCFFVTGTRDGMGAGGLLSRVTLPRR